MSERWQIPENWLWVNLGDISEVIGGGTPSTGDESNFDANGIPWITPADLTGFSNTYISKGRRSLSKDGYAKSSARLIPAGSVLLSSRAPIGYCVVAENELCTSQGFKNFVLKGSVNPEYVRFYLLYSKNYLESISSGTTFKELSGAKASTIAFPLAPLNEQLIIVRFLSILNDKLRQTRSHLEFTLKLINVLKAKILEKAYTGALTDTWRLKYKENKPQATELRNLISTISYGSAAKSSRTGKLPVLRMGNIQDGLVDWKDLVFTSDEKEIKKFTLEPGDVLFNRTNSPELVGKTAVFKGEREAIYAGYLIKVRCSDNLLPDFLNICLNSPQGKEFCRRVKSDGISQSNINANKLKSFVLPLPSIHEQHEIINIVDRNFNRIKTLKQTTEIALSKIYNLETSFLSKAYSGELTKGIIQKESSMDIINNIEILDNSGFVIARKVKQKSKITVSMKKKLVDVLTETQEWLSAQEAFQRCGIRLDATTEDIEPLYAELRALDKSGILAVQPVLDSNGRKLYDRLKIIN